MKKILLALPLFIILYSIFPKAAHSSFDFPAKYDITYTYSQDHPTKVHQKIILTNRFSQLHPTSYRLEIVGESPANITARDAGGLLKYQVVSQTENQTVIEFVFNRPVVGKGKSYTFDVYYEIDSATQTSSMWEIHLPQVGNIDPNDTYKFHLLVPNSMGPLIGSHPAPSSTNTSSHPGFVHVQYNASDLQSQTGLATFGYKALPPQVELLYPIQIFPPLITKLQLKIKNPNSYAIDAQEIPLSSTNLPLKSNTLFVPSLYPDQTTIIDIPLQRFFVPQMLPKTITLNVGKDQIPYNIPSLLFILWYVLFILIVASALVYGGHTAHRAGSIHLQKRKK